MNDLNKLAILYNTDKSSEIHDYCRKYEKYLPFKRLVDHVNFNGIINTSYKYQHARREDLLIPYSIKVQPDCRTDIESINFLNSLILITKR